MHRVTASHSGPPNSTRLLLVLLVVAAAVASPAAALLLSDLFTRMCRVIGTLTSAADDPSLLALLHLRHYAKGALTHGK